MWLLSLCKLGNFSKWGENLCRSHYHALVKVRQYYGQRLWLLSLCRTLQNYAALNVCFTVSGTRPKSCGSERVSHRLWHAPQISGRSDPISVYLSDEPT